MTPTAMELAELQAAEDRQLMALLQQQRPVGLSEFADPRKQSRALRRKLGWRGPVGLHQPAPALVRFVRRHRQRVLDAAQFNARPVRRVRKERARIIRAVAARGLA